VTDGVIKYSIEHSEIDTPPKFSGYGELEALRRRLFSLGLIGEKNGIGYGNLSTRAGNSNAFFITATQTGDRQKLGREHYTYISKYDFDTFMVFSQGIHKPSSEALSHAMIYEVDAAIKAVIHVHSFPLWEYMIGINDLATTAAYGTAEMVSEIAALYSTIDPLTNNAFVMKGHEEGIIIFGRDAQEAELALYAIIRDYLADA